MPELKTQTQKMQSSKPNTVMVFLKADLYWNAGQTKIIAVVLHTNTPLILQGILIQSKTILLISCKSIIR